VAPILLYGGITKRWCSPPHFGRHRRRIDGHQCLEHPPDLGRRRRGVAPEPAGGQVAAEPAAGEGAVECADEVAVPSGSVREKGRDPPLGASLFDAAPRSKREKHNRSRQLRRIHSLGYDLEVANAAPTGDGELMGEDEARETPPTASISPRWSQ